MNKPIFLSLTLLYSSVANTLYAKDLDLAEGARLEKYHSLLEMAENELSKGRKGVAIKLLQGAQKVDQTKEVTKKLAGLYFENYEHQLGLTELEKLISEKLDARSLEDIVLELIKYQYFDEASDYLVQHLDKFPSERRLHFLSSIIDYERGFVEKSFNSILILIDSNSKEHSEIGDKESSVLDENLSFKNVKAVAKLGSSPLNLSKTSFFSQDMESVHVMAVLHACRMLCDVSGELQHQWVKKLEDVGVSHIETWKKLVISSNSRRRELENIYFSNLENTVYLELAINQYVTRPQLLWNSFSRVSQSYLHLPEKLYAKAQKERDNLSVKIREKIKYCVPFGTSKEEHVAKIIKVLSQDEKVDIEGLSAFFSANKWTSHRKKMISPDSEIVPFLHKFIEQNEDLSMVKIDPLRRGNKLSSREVMYLRARNVITNIILRGDDYRKIAELITEDKGIKQCIIS